MLCDQVQLTSELTDQYTSLLLTGKSLYIDLPSISDNTVQFFPGNEGKFSIVSSRQYSRLNTLIITFFRPETSTDGLHGQDVNNFYLPASAEDTIASNLVINGNRMPAFDNVGVRQHWNRFLRAVGAYGGVGTSTSISFKGFGGQGLTDPTTQNPAGVPTTETARNFAVIFDLEKMSNHSSTGEPMNSGSSLTVNIEGLGGTGEHIQKAFITAHHNGVLEIRDSGCAIYT